MIARQELNNKLEIQRRRGYHSNNDRNFSRYKPLSEPNNKNQWFLGCSDAHSRLVSGEGCCLGWATVVVSMSRHHDLHLENFASAVRETMASLDHFFDSKRLRK